MGCSPPLPPGTPKNYLHSTAVSRKTNSIEMISTYQRCIFVQLSPLDMEKKSFQNWLHLYPILNPLRGGGMWIKNKAFWQKRNFTNMNQHHLNSIFTLSFSFLQCVSLFFFTSPPRVTTPPQKKKKYMKTSSPIYTRVRICLLMLCCSY